MPLDETIDPDQSGHVADHQAIAVAVNALPTTYVPQSGDRVLLTADQFIVSAGTPNLSLSASRFAAYIMDSASLEQVNVSFWLPSYWATFDVDLWWSNAGAGSGNVVWASVRSIRGDAQDLSAGDSFAGLGTIAAPAQDILKVSAGVLTGIANDSSKFHHIRVMRVGDDAADTLTTDAFFLGLMLRRAS